MKKNIALYGTAFYSTGGGLFIITLVTSALSLKKDQKNFNLYLLVPKHIKITPFKLIKKPFGLIKRLVKKLLGIEKKQNFVESKTIVTIIREIDKDIKIIFYDNTKPKELEKVLKKIKADVLVPVTTPMPKNFPYKWIGCFYDFQYKYHPELFPGIEIKARDEEISSIFENTKSVITISENSKKEIEKFFPNHKCNVFTLPLASYPKKEWLSEDFGTIKKKYSLPEQYFLISNQLWVHKSHETAFKALKTFVETIGNKSVHIVCTGITYDHRFPEYFDNLKKLILELHLEENIHFLGHIPKNDQMKIMQHSIALIQPTLFEGSPGGGSCQDAIVLGIPTIVSDIPVNLELKDNNITFFKAKSHDDLSKKMLSAYKNHERNGFIHKLNLELILKKASERIEKTGDIILEAIEHALSDK